MFGLSLNSKFVLPLVDAQNNFLFEIYMLKLMTPHKSSHS